VKCELRWLDTVSKSSILKAADADSLKREEEEGMAVERGGRRRSRRG
jgi:hypothetical protein